MATKITKEDLSSILRRIQNQKDLSSVRVEIDDIADEYNLDLTEPLDIDEELIVNEDDMYLGEDEVEEIVKKSYWDDDEEDDDY